MQNYLMLATFALSGPFLLWSTVSMAVLIYRCQQTIPQYKWWHTLPEQQHTTLVMLPGMALYLEWASYQRFRLVWNLLSGRWAPLPDLDVVIQLGLGAMAACAIMWSVLCILFGQSTGVRVWRKMVLLGGLLGLALCIICAYCGPAIR